MNQVRIAQAKDKDLPASLVAMHRAARQARELAIRTNSAIIVIRDGKLVRISAEWLRHLGVG